MPKEIKAIAFDAARVLMNFDTGIFVRAVSPHSSFTEEEILSKIKNSSALKKFDKGEILSNEFYQELVKILQLKDFSFEMFKAEWKKILYWSNDDLKKILDLVKPDIKLLIVANMDKLSWEVFTNFPLIQKYFSDKKQRIVSCEVGFAKPDANIYNESLKRFDVDFSQSLFVDDNQENLEQVSKLGGNIIHYDCRIHSVEYLGKKLDEFNVSA